MPEPSITPTSVLRDGTRLIGRFVRMHPLAFTIAVLGAATYAGAIIFSSWVIGWLTDNVVIPILDGGEEPDLLWLAAAVIVFVAILKAAGIVVRRTGAAYLTGATRRDIRNTLLAHQLTLKMSWFNRQAIGDLLAVADADTDQGTGVLGPLPYATGVSLLLVGTIALISAIDIWLGVGAVIGLLVVIVIDVKGSWVTFGMWEEVQVERGRVSAIAHETFDGALTVKALGREDHVSAKFEVASDTLRDRIIGVLSTWTKYQVVIRALPQMLIIVLIVVGAARVAAEAVTPGEIVTVAYLLTLLAFPIQLIGFVLWDLAGSLAGWRRVQEVLDASEHVEYGEEKATTAGGPPRSPDRQSGSPTTGNRCWTTSTWSYGREPPSRSSDRPHRASRPSVSCSRGSGTPIPARSISRTAISGISPGLSYPRKSHTCRRTPSCSMPRLGRTSPSMPRSAKTR